MFRSIARFVIHKPEYVAVPTICGGTLMGSGIGFYGGYIKSRTQPYSDFLIGTTCDAIIWGCVGFLAAVTLPITLPIAVCATVVRLTDDVLYKKDKNVFGKIVLFPQETWKSLPTIPWKNIRMNIEDIFD
jgi:hypothetical protein